MQKVAVIGLGRFGMALAENLAKEGIEVIAIDSKPDIVNDIKDRVALAVQADATDLETQRSLGLGKVDTVVVAIGENFEACQLAMLAARDLDFPRVIARANDRVKETILRRLGADEVILPEEQAALKLSMKLAKPSLLEAVEIGSEHSFVQVKAPPGVRGKTLMELQLRKNFGLNLVAIRNPAVGAGPGSGSESISIPGPDTVPQEDDVLMLVGKDKDIDRFLREME
ncbi:MAG: TrkA family potassium uptake protein [Planctomycetes bacterium]|nr:TrkA family potassium uptake protein [Planctomycetota bacterium]